MSQSHRHQHTVCYTQLAASSNSGFTPTRIAAAVQKALLSGLAFSALAVVTPLAIAQTANTVVKYAAF